LPKKYCHQGEKPIILTDRLILVGMFLLRTVSDGHTFNRRNQHMRHHPHHHLINQQQEISSKNSSIQKPYFLTQSLVLEMYSLTLKQLRRLRSLKTFSANALDLKGHYQAIFLLVLKPNKFYERFFYPM